VGSILIICKWLAQKVCVCFCRPTGRLPIALVYRSTAGWYFPVLKATLPSSFVFSAIAKVSCGSDGGVGVVGGGVCDRGGVLELDPDAWLAFKNIYI